MNWIDVKSRPLPQEGRIIITDGEREAVVQAGKWWVNMEAAASIICEIEHDNITHWMPAPPLPGKTESSPMDKDYLRLAAQAISDRLPDNHGFILLTFQFGEGGRLYYTANCDRKDAINAMKEFIIKDGSGEDWMKHV